MIDKSSAQVALVVDCNKKLLGIVTDGDIRRGILKGMTIDASVVEIMNPHPFCLGKHDLPSDPLFLMQQKLIHHIPVIDENNCIVDLFILDDLISKPTLPNPVVIMAGGKGERLGTLTKKCPKPMLTIKGKPILEIIIENCINSGFKQFYISVNYLKETIIDYFGSGDKWNITINYLEENKPLGTCGSLSHLPNDIKHDLILMNGDVITELEFNRFLNFHLKKDTLLSVCSRNHRVRVPFAVFNTQNEFLQDFIEKPMYEYQINAGVYALKPMLLKRIPNDYFHTTDLIEMLVKEKKYPAIFPIHENWIDIGSPVDFNSAQTRIC